MLKEIVKFNSEYFYDFRIPILNLESLIHMLLENRLKDIHQHDIIYVFTPQNNVIKLPKDSTPIDFAFKIHSDIGNKCAKALVDGQNHPLEEPLMSGETVEIITGSKYQFKKELINSVKTSLAKNSLERNRDRNFRNIGWQLIKNTFGKNVRSYKKKLAYATNKFNLSSVDCLALQVGSEKITIKELKEGFKEYDSIHECESGLNCLLPINQDYLLSKINHKNIKISSCCAPTPKQEIKGILRVSNGSIESMIVHSSCCNNLNNIAPKKLISLEWNCEYAKVKLQITLSDNPDSLRPILNTLAEQLIHTNLHSVNPCIKNNKSLVLLEININSSQKISDILASIENTPQVDHIKIKHIIPFKKLDSQEENSIFTSKITVK